MVDRTHSLEGDAEVGDILVKIRGRHYLIPAEAIGSPLEDGGTEVLGMLEKELSALGATGDFAMELGESEDDRNARAITARSGRQCVRQSRQCARQSRQCARQSRQCTRSARAIHPQAV
jgi:hypothetical protein